MSAFKVPRDAAVVVCMAMGLLLPTASGAMASWTKLCLPHKEGRAVLTSVKGACPKHYALTEVGAMGATGAEGKEGAKGVGGDEGEIGAAGAQGVTGATGPRGATGATGATGVTGATGPTGPQGTTGATGPEGKEGLQGPTGQSALSPLPSGQSESGEYGLRPDNTKTSGGMEQSITFPIPLSEGLPAGRLAIATTETPGAHCSGPGHAERGYLCIYSNEKARVIGPVVLDTEGPSPPGVGTGRFGFNMAWTITGEDAYDIGTYTVTAP
jgi:hypothetical protein